MDLKTLLLSLLSLAIASCGGHKGGVKPDISPDEVAVFTSSDEKLQKSYEWARRMALSYSHDASDPV